ncbi:hypothetical protein QWJ34_24395 [Saccharibacillus sp. CPCC 101409]|uniref:hypothetical protein n=1 Tax=Saccharibacillus sp. CPCC 101409 TaxID=3058041 RepID=UPI00267184B6|nr:hypothetical protein [Saccharibacillus sp. CPCC 101409]MDO3412928.1 hypothetical protein [Saccharibacillus sp. CPCC 101409]
MLEQQRENGNATIYQYQLIRKFNIPRPLLLVYLLLPIPALLAGTFFFSWSALIYMPIALLLVLWIHFVVSHSVLLIRGPIYRKKWRLRTSGLWLGFLPDQHIRYAVFQQVVLQTLWIGFVFIGIMVAWVPLPFTLALLFCHIWFMAPRLAILLSMRGQRSDVMVKLNAQDVSYYIQ